MKSKLWYSTYIESLLNKDIRDNLKREHVTIYDHFIKLLGARCGQELKYQELAKKLGVSNLTIQSWISLLDGPMNGALFENFLIAEIYKFFSNRGIKAPLYHFRDSQGVEVDLVIKYETKHTLFEIKSTMSPRKNHRSGLGKVAKLFSEGETNLLFNTKEEVPLAEGISAINWLGVFKLLDKKVRN